jgi:type II secretory pathway pseudopilin PulG
MGIRKQGLTLLEVLAAFLIFSMVFTVLVGSSQTAVRSQGLSVRRLAAYEIAQSALADLEIAMARHDLPSVDEDESESDGFVVRVHEATLMSEDSQNQPSASPDLDLGGTDLVSQMAAQLPEIGKFLMRYDVEVEWTEASRPETITTTTFAFDWTGAREEFPELFAAGGSDPDGSRGSRDGDSSDDRDSRSDEDGRESRDDRQRRDDQRDSGSGDKNCGNPNGSKAEQIEYMKCMIGQ